MRIEKRPKGTSVTYSGAFAFFGDVINGHETFVMGGTGGLSQFGDNSSPESLLRGRIPLRHIV